MNKGWHIGSLGYTGGATSSHTVFEWIAGWIDLGIANTTSEPSARPRAGSDMDDHYIGSRWADAYMALRGDDYVYGAGGDDTLSGGSGNDYLFGGVGDDVITGDQGDDYLVGGAGADRFVFYPDAASDYDIISDFDPSIDQIVLQHAHLANMTSTDPIAIADTSGGSWIDVFGSIIFLMNVQASEIDDDVFIVL